MAYGRQSQLKMSEETFNFTCTTCAEDGRTLEALKYCVQCRRYCCVSCVDAHKFPALRGHKLRDINQGMPTPLLPELSTVHYRMSPPDSHLEDMMDSIASVMKIRETKLQTLHKTRKETLDKVTTFYKLLEAIIWNAAENSRKQVEAAYEDVEANIFKEKRSVDQIYRNLQMMDEKLKRAQRFEHTKMATEILKDAESEMKKDILHCMTEISFIPNQTLANQIKGLENIGQVHKEVHEKKDVNKKQNFEQDVYKIKDTVTTNISIRLSNDTKACYPVGCCAARANRLLVTDCSNKKLKSLDVQTLTVVDYCTLDSSPQDVCYTGKHEVAVACVNEKKIQFVSIGNTMTPTRQIKTSHQCYGIAYMDGKLYVTNSAASLYIYDMTAGTLLKKVSQDNNGNRLFDRSRHIAFNTCGNMFVGGGYNGVVCLDVLGEYLCTLTDADLSFADGVCADGRGNVFVVGQNSHNVVQFSENGTKVGVVVSRDDGLHDPLSVCFHPGLNRMFTVIENSDVVKMYELK